MKHYICYPFQGSINTRQLLTWARDEIANGYPHIGPLSESDARSILDDAGKVTFCAPSDDERYDAQFDDEPYDTPCIEDGRDNCDDWGTGEGRYHGRV